MPLRAENDYYVDLYMGSREFGDFPGGEPVLWLDGACAALHHGNQWCYSCYTNKQLTHSLSFLRVGIKLASWYTFQLSAVTVHFI